MTDSIKLFTEDNNMIGRKLKELRKEHKIFQEELARALDVTTSSVGHYEIDSKNPSYEVLVKISRYFCVSTDWLLGVTNDKNKSIDIPKDYAVIVSKVLSGEVSPDKLKKLIEFAKGWEDK